MTTQNETANLLLAARQSNDADAIAIALAKHADTLVKEGRIGEARLLLDEAASIHKEKGRIYDEARCTQFAATLCRLEGKLDAAAIRANHAGDLIGHGNPIAVSVATELGEIALARGDAAAAAEAYGHAMTEGESADLLPAAQAALRRKRAVALANVNQFAQAAIELAAASQQYFEAGHVTDAIRAKIEQATALQSGIDVAAATRVRDEARQMAEQAADHTALAELYLLSAAQAVERRDLSAAMEAVKVARNEALLGVAPLSYISAACAISEIAEKQGNRLEAYEALVVGWATLGDLLGKKAAKETFAPKIETLLDQWGETVFRKIKTKYEEKRRAELNTTP